MDLARGPYSGARQRVQYSSGSSLLRLVRDAVDERPRIAEPAA
ncbi:hypothetical protein [Sphaerisporangium perillae]|nr:hypothetical protein [Sphaerisporangium perillae]